MWVSLCSACALAGIANGIEINSYFYIGIIVFIIGFTAEIIADNQKTVNLEKILTTKINL
jgi:steroid 5-alpha reductase family enzyme